MYLIVPVGEGIGETKGEVRVVSILSGMTGLERCGCDGPRSSRRDVNASLIWVDGKRMIHLQEK